MTNSIPIKLSKERTESGTHPIVIIGPNGSGKTRYGAEKLTKLNEAEAEFLPAFRNTIPGRNIPRKSLHQANQEWSEVTLQTSSAYWQIFNDIDSLFAKLLAEHTDLAVKFYDQSLDDQSLDGKATKPEITNLRLLQKMWHGFFPGRNIDLSAFTPTAMSEHGQEITEYPAYKMSDGEKAALYLGARVLSVQAKVLIVDEPEVHFHSRLAVQFWDAMESLRPNIRFVYITHNLTFALSRKSAKFVIIKNKDVPEVISLEPDLPQSIVESILGAASFSIYAQRIVFCEGTESSEDYLLFSNWFKGRETVVIPAGNCLNVVQCTKAFNNQRVISGVSVIGIIDRDYWPKAYLNSLPPSIQVLQVHEIENLFCLRRVFEPVAIHRKKDSDEASDLYDKFLSKAGGKFTGELLTKQVSERFKCRCKGLFDSIVNRMAVTEELDTTQSDHVSALAPSRHLFRPPSFIQRFRGLRKIWVKHSSNFGAFTLSTLPPFLGAGLNIYPSSWEQDPESIFQEERDRIEDALSGNEKDFIELFPGKVFIGIAAQLLGLNLNSYRVLVRSALAAEEEDRLYTLGQELEVVLSNYLPPRRTSSVD
ncbi:MAG: AAA family ATPase [Candidatus Eremiobacteraeota bacterium]|nr:AAA family ATPase [Candidatus Eremiobacteraeota bacterium]